MQEQSNTFKLIDGETFTAGKYPGKTIRDAVALGDTQYFYWIRDASKATPENKALAARVIESFPSQVSPVLTFGKKYKGKTLTEIAADIEGRGYLEWMLERVKTISNGDKSMIKNALGQVAWTPTPFPTTPGYF